MPNLAGYGKAASKHTKTAASHEVAIFVPFLKKAFKPNIKHIYYYALFTFVILLEKLTERFISHFQQYKINHLFIILAKNTITIQKF